MALREITNQRYAWSDGPQTAKRQKIGPVSDPSLNNRVSPIKVSDEMKALQGSIWRARSEVSEMQVTIEKLEKLYGEAQLKLDAAEDELTAVTGTDRNLRLKAIRDGFTEFKAEQKLRFDEAIDRMALDYDERARNALEVEEREFQLQVESLRQESAELKLDLQRLEDEFNSARELEQKRHELEQQNSRLEAAKSLRETELQSQRVDSKVRLLERQLEEAHNESAEVRRAKEASEKEYDELKRKAEEFENGTASVRTEIDRLGDRVKQLEAERQKYRDESEWFIDQEQALLERAVSQQETRRVLHEELQGLKGNIRVFCRVKPEPQSLRTRRIHMDFKEDEEDAFKDDIRVVEPETCQRGRSPRSYNFAFDKVFTPESHNSEIFGEISQLVQSALDGYNVCVFAYGQTGSGKTYTMSNSGDGMIPSSLRQIFGRTKELSRSGWSYKVTGQFLEIYGKNLNDLLADNYLRDMDKNKGEIKHDDFAQRTNVANVSTVSLENAGQANELIRRATANRATAATKANQRSSRSHSVFIIRLSGENEVTGESAEGTLNLIDLAGSERTSHSGVVGTRLKETMSINKSLSALGDVMTALKNKDSHIPYRNSKLTYLLKYSLGGNSKTLMFVNVSANADHFSETLNSLRFAQKVNETHIGQPTS